MAFQSTVNELMSIGVPGQIVKLSDNHVTTGIINSGAQANTVGFYCTQVAATGQFTVGGNLAAATNAPGGILLGGNDGHTFGSTSGTLDATLNVPNNSTQSFLARGYVCVALTGPCNIGDKVQYNTITGALSTVASTVTTPTAGNLFIPISSNPGGASQGAVVIEGTNLAAGIALIKLT